MFIEATDIESNDMFTEIKEPRGMYGCFEPDTIIMYTTTDKEDENKFYYDSIKNIYEKYREKPIQVYREFIDLEKGLCVGVWEDAVIKQCSAIQEIDVYCVPITFSENEWEDIIRVTPEHQFPVRRKDKIENVPAYLLQTGDELIFEDSQYDDSLLDEDLTDSQRILIRSIAKVEKKEFEEAKDYFGIDFLKSTVLKDDKVVFEDIDCSSYYMLMPNGLIINS